MRQCWNARRMATAIDKNSPKVRRCEDSFATVQIKPHIFTLPRCKSAELFFSCCGSLEALALVNCNEHVPSRKELPFLTFFVLLWCVVHGAFDFNGNVLRFASTPKKYRLGYSFLGRKDEGACRFWFTNDN
jgi:hypothetical protein